MAAGNGDERQAAAWERVEAKLDRQNEELRGMRRLLEALTDRAMLQAREIDGLRAELSGMRDETRQGLQRVREELELRLAKLRVDMGAARVEAIEEQLAELRRRLEPAP